VNKRRPNAVTQQHIKRQIEKWRGIFNSVQVGVEREASVTTLAGLVNSFGTKKIDAEHLVIENLA
jgi:hypothetical protein